MSVNWSAEIPFDQAAVRRRVSQKPGVCEIRQSPPYMRYHGTATVIKIGKSTSDLQAEILSHFVRHTAENRLARIRAQSGVAVSVVFTELSGSEGGLLERELLCQFEDRHFDLPVLNSQ